MDFGSIINTMMSSDSVSQLSSLTGTSEKDVSSILTSALPQLLSGAQGQATNADTAQSFANALAAHGQKDSADLSSFLSGIDLDDGQKIVNHLLGSDNAVATAETLSQESGVASTNISGILSAAAPLLMNLLGKQAEKETENASGGLDLGGIVGSLFGGGDDKDSGGGLDLGGILTGLFKK